VTRGGEDGEGGGTERYTYTCDIESGGGGVVEDEGGGTNEAGN